MEASVHSHRALTAGLSAGAGLAITAAAFAATIPFEQVHEALGASAVPFAVGSVAGVGLFAIGLGIADTYASSEHDRTACKEASATQRAVGQSTYRRQATPKGVPVIARASDALSEEEAWADIDALLSADSPVSCDPTRSKDIYEIALEEMARGSERSTTAYATRPVAPVVPTPTQAASDVIDPFAYTPQPDDTLLAWDAPSSSQASVTAQIPVQEPYAAPRPAVPFADMPVVTPQPAVLVQAVPAVNGYDVTVSADMLDIDEPEFDAGYDGEFTQIEMVDYSGHEDMWAAALAILAEDDDVTTVAAPVDLGDTDAVDAERMSAVAEGAEQTGRHTRVNQMLEEEFDRVPSQGMRRTSHEYLRVIQGGTQTLPRMTVEA